MSNITPLELLKKLEWSATVTVSIGQLNACPCCYGWIPLDLSKYPKPDEKAPEFELFYGRDTFGDRRKRSPHDVPKERWGHKPGCELDKLVNKSDEEEV
jgi:hypothetical protein